MFTAIEPLQFRAVAARRGALDLGIVMRGEVLQDIREHLHWQTDPRSENPERSHRLSAEPPNPEVFAPGKSRALGLARHATPRDTTQGARLIGRRSRAHALAVIVAHCVAHARRKFIEVAPSFPAPCRHVLGGADLPSTI